MGYTVDDRQVRADVFTESGKWKYIVALDCSDVDYDDWDLWRQAKRALVRATVNETSGVRFAEIPVGWYMVVLEPYSRHSHPVMVKG